MKKIALVALVGITALSLTGCASLRGQPERSEEARHRIESLQKSYFLPKVDVLAVYETKNATDKKSYRSTVVHGRMMAIDLQFAIFTKEIYNEGVGSNLALDIAGVAVGGAGAVVSSADGSKILSALSGGLSGTKTAINKNLYYERTMPALMALMDAEREKIKAEIVIGLNQEISKYSLGEALVDLEEYYLSGTIPGAIASVTSTAGSKKDEAQAIIEDDRDKRFVDVGAQERVDALLNSVDSLPVGGAWKVLEAPPSALDAFVATGVQARLGGTALNAAAGKLGGPGNDDNAKAILKFIVVLIEDRSKENLDLWKAAIMAAQQ